MTNKESGASGDMNPDLISTYPIIYKYIIMTLHCIQSKNDPMNNGDTLYYKERESKVFEVHSPAGKTG